MIRKFLRSDVLDTRKFSQALGDLIKIISKCTDKRYDDEIRTWIMSATLRIWAGNKLCAEEYAEALTVFSNQEFSTAQVVTALNCAGDEERELVIPEFFKALLKTIKRKIQLSVETLQTPLATFSCFRPC